MLCDKAEAWVSLDLQKGQWSKASPPRCDFRRSLENFKSGHQPDLNPIENLWWDLTEAVAARNPKNISELEAIVRNGLRFLRNATRSCTLAIHYVCSRP